MTDTLDLFAGAPATPAPAPVAEHGLFARPGPRWFTVAPHRPFLHDLAAGLLAELEAGGPEALSGAVVLTPTRRGARALAQAFVSAAGGRALLLPQIRALGDLDEGEPPFEPGDIAADLPPAVTPLRRRFELARLVAEHGEALGRRPDAAGALDLADALAGFLDSCAIEEVEARDRLPDLAPAELARHWALSRDFLGLAVEAWPARLAELGLVDVTARRTELLRVLARQWSAHPPAHPLIAAGSTGTAPATADLLAVVAACPRGAVVLPGLDLERDEAVWSVLHTPDGEAHPQGAMARLLRRAGIARSAVRPWPGSEPSRASVEEIARARVLNEALRPAGATQDWLSVLAQFQRDGEAAGINPLRSGLAGLSVLSARDEEAAAAQAAVLLREALETPGATAALVTPDAALARRVSARLERWGVHVDNSAGSPLSGFPAGVLLCLLARAVADPLDPAGLLALAKHPLTLGGMRASHLDRARLRLERQGLRGPRPAGWTELEARLEGEADALQLAAGLRAAIDHAAAPFAAGPAAAEVAVRALAEGLERLGSDDGGRLGELWAGPGGEAAASLVAALVDDGAGLPPATAHGFAQLVEALAAQQVVRTGGETHPRVQILGAIEARLVRADRLVLAGLEEGVWPRGAAVDPFLSRPMRQALGLPPPERRTGLAAHDFAQAACAPVVTLIHAERRGGQPAVKSRWLWRLETLARGAQTAAEREGKTPPLPTRPEVAAWAAALDAPLAPAPPELRLAARPAPTPPVEARPREMGVTRVEEWVRNPYATYARFVLKLKPLDPPDAPVEARGRGTAVHKAFERFALEGDPRAEAFERLLMEELGRAGLRRARMAREAPLARRLSTWVADWSAGRGAAAAVVSEAKGRLEFTGAAGAFTLTAKADRLEARPGGVDVLDFKTGQAPTPKQVRTGFAPQLTLTAAILQAGGFPELGPAAPGDLAYLRVTGRRLPGEEHVRAAGGGESADMAAAALAGLQGHVARYDAPDTAYRAWTAPQFISARGGDYDHLARSVGVARAGRGGGGVTPQLQASDPTTSAFVAANAGSGKTTTLVNRVARLLLRGAEPEAILCLTYTKAAAAEMQRRLFDTLGGWSTLDDDALATALAKIGEGRRDLPRARTLFARALETPGGLKIQTIHAFCEKLLRRFPLEAGVSPGFTVLEGAAQGEVQQHARELLAELALAQPAVGEAYAHFAVELDPAAFDGLLLAFECEREALAAYLERGDPAADVWRRCGFPSGEPADPEALEQEAAAACDWARWKAAGDALLATGMSSDEKLARRLLGLVECAATQPGGFSDCLRVFSTSDGERSKVLGTKGLDPRQRDWLVEEQDRLHTACGRATGARQAVDTVHALTLAAAYVELYAGAKGDRGALDFSDLVARTRSLLTDTADAAWVLYKLDGGVDHVLVDEAQDTAPAQWDIVRALTADFFAGEGGRGGGRRLERTVFAVGDEKQSIYGFQGAAPELLGAESRRYDALAQAAGRPFAAPALLESWRSTAEVLRFVDALGADPTFREGVQPASSNVLHHPRGRRDDTPGQVDLWPLFQDEPRDEPAAWDAPVDARANDSAVKQLARALAESIRDMGVRGEAVWDRMLHAGAGALRPVRPGDVLILVRRRGALFEEILRELKRAGVPVAGADRLKLSDHVAFDDVLALIRFVLFPWDDLTLAALLRSPFCGVDEEGLYHLAHGREGSLFAELNRRGDERPDWAEARRFLGAMREAARGRGPFDVLGRALGWLDAQGRTVRQRVVTRLGVEAGEALDELLAYALAAEARGVTDLERFAGELGRADVEVKRELEGADADGPLSNGEGAVRVMTVHGAKGLEAPVVILPDTCGGQARARDALLKTGAFDGDGGWTPDGGFLFAPRAREDTPASADARAARKAREAAEQLRLLYVALTRARDRVIVAGRISSVDKGPTRGGWYEQVSDAFDRLAADGVGADAGGAVREVWDGARLIRRFGREPAFALAAEAAPAPVDAAPAWLRDAAPPEPESSRYASPSTYAEGRRGPAPSPLAAAPGGLGRFRRGELVHRLLQLLPDLPAAERPAAAERWLARERDLADDQRREMARAALGVLDDPRFAEVWAPGSKAEAAVAGSAPELPEGLAVSGRVDRLLVTPERVWVVDFKTNRPSPDRIEGADPAYIAQMAIYAAVLRAVFPGRRVEAALVWTDGPKLMPVPDNVMDAALQRIRAGR